MQENPSVRPEKEQNTIAHFGTNQAESSKNQLKKKTRKRKKFGASNYANKAFSTYVNYVK